MEKMRKNTTVLFLFFSFFFVSLPISAQANAGLIKEAEQLKAEACRTNNPKAWKASQERWEELANQAQYLGFPKSQVLEFWIEEIWASQEACRPPE